jgi:hypothetical protein
MENNDNCQIDSFVSLINDNMNKRTDDIRNNFDTNFARLEENINNQVKKLQKEFKEHTHPHIVASVSSLNRTRKVVYTFIVVAITGIPSMAYFFLSKIPPSLVNKIHTFLFLSK